MKKSLIVFGMVVVWLLNMIPVHADAIWEPRSDFYEEHASECTYNNRNYTACGPEGEVKVYVSPENATVVDVLENGKSVCVLFTYKDEDGVEWGVVENFDDQSKTGWLAMDYMNVVYDYISFKQEYGSEFVQETGMLDAEYKGKTVKFWSYPGADGTGYEIKIDAADDYLPEYNQVFVDEEGHKWGYIGYYFGLKNTWVCLDNASATAEELYPNGLPARGTETTEFRTEDDVTDERKQEAEDDETEEEAEEEAEAEIVPKGNEKLVLIVSGLVAGVAALTGGLLVWLKKKKK